MSDHDQFRHDFFKMLSRPLPPITMPEEREVLSAYIEHLTTLADGLPARSAVRLAFRLHALAVQDRIDEYDERERESR